MTSQYPSLPQPTFAVINLGCRVNRVESDTIAACLLDAGACRANLQQAQVVVINTCTVTGEATKKTRKAVHRALKEAQQATVVVTGCAVAIDPTSFESMSDRVVAEPHKEKAAACALEALGLQHHQQAAAAFTRAGKGFTNRAGIKVQDGCANACTFCIVHKARGPVWSKPAQEVIAEVQAAEEAGIREIVLTGINLGAWQQDDVRLQDLLQQLLSHTQHLRIRLSSIEPPEVTPKLIELMAASEGRICRHLHLPLQSGSSEVLAAMGRRYDAPAFSSLIDALRAAMPDISLSTDIMVGFPGETEEDFAQTLEAACYARFSKIHAFRYSKRPQTPAAQMPNQVPAEVSVQRAHQLADVGEKLRAAYMASLVGTTEQVLLEQSCKGTCERFVPAYVPAAPEAVGELLQVEVMEATQSGLVCRVVP